MIERAQVIGAGRVGSAMAARLRERGLDLSADEPELVLLCVPDRAIAEVAAALEAGPWVAHVSGATPLAALDPHERRFGLHPLQTFTRDRGAEQLDGAFAAVTAETDRGARGRRLAGANARPRAVPARRREARRLPRRRGDRLQLSRHAAAGRGLAARGRRRAAGGARPADAPDDRERLRADRADLTRRLGNRRRPHRRDPSRATRARADVRDAGRDDEGAGVMTARSIGELRRELASRQGSIGLVPTMGALARRPRGADPRRARRERRRRRQPLRQRSAVRRRLRPGRISARRGPRFPARGGSGR